MIRIIHVSDIHMRSSKYRTENRNAKGLVKSIIDRFGSHDKKKSFIVMTGDLVDDGKSKQYKLLQNDVINPLEKNFNILAVAGNHDYASWGNIFKKKAVGRFDQYVRKIPPFPEPFVDESIEANERKILFIGVDSADPYDKVFFADGIVYEKQCDRVKAILNDKKYKDYFKVLYVHHHPFLRKWFVAFQHATEFLDVIKNRANLLLFGHKHEHESFFGRYGIHSMLASGKVTEPVGDGLSFRVIEIEKTGDPHISTIEVQQP